MGQIVCDFHSEKSKNGRAKVSQTFSIWYRCLIIFICKERIEKGAESPVCEKAGRPRSKLSDPNLCELEKGMR